jgi:hypothetical protein
MLIAAKQSPRKPAWRSTRLKPLKRSLVTSCSPSAKKVSKATEEHPALKPDGEPNHEIDTDDMS